VASRRGIISYRVPQALYQAWRMAQLLKDIARPRVLEIGAGLGRTAFYARKFGILDYTIIDIPVTALSQGYYLGRVLGEDQIHLAGEDRASSDERIKILPPSYFLTGEDRYDLILNADS